MHHGSATEILLEISGKAKHLKYKTLQVGRAFSQWCQGLDVVVAQVEAREVGAEVQVLDGRDVVVGQVQRSEGRQVQGGVHPVKGIACAVQARQVAPEDCGSTTC